MHFYVREMFCDFFTLGPSDLNTTLTTTFALVFVLCRLEISYPFLRHKRHAIQKMIKFMVS